MQQVPCSETGGVRRRGRARASVAQNRAASRMRRRLATNHHGTPWVTRLQRSVFTAIMRPHMRTSFVIRIHAPRRVESGRRATRGATIALALAAFHFASVGSNIVTKVHAQGLVPSLPTDPDPKDLVRAELIADAQALAPGRPFRLAVRLVMKEGWHVNWLNPGDAGLAPSIAWKLPKGFKADLVCWPVPGRFPAGPLVIFGYAGELLLSVDVTPPVELRPGDSVKLAAEVSWLACAEACIPGSASLSLVLPVETTPRSNASTAALIEDGRKRCPAPSGAWNVDARIDDRQTMQLWLQTAADNSAPVTAAFFFPYEQGIVENAAPQLLSVEQDQLGRSSYQLRVEVSRVATHVPERLRGVLVIEGSATSGGSTAIEVDVPLRTR